MKTSIALLLIVSLGLGGTKAQSLGLKNVITSTKDVAKDVTNLLPTPRGLFDVSKQLLAGYPFEFVSSSINKICSSALSVDAIKSRVTPDIKKMNFQLRTACNKYTYPLLEADHMWKSPEFDPSKKVVILATGWTSTVNDSDTIDVMAKAYNCRGDVNFVAVDAASFVDTLYTWSALNTEAIGKSIATGLIQLSEIVPISNIHLIGHSLGAHIVASAGRTFYNKTGKMLPHITGLDPAKPCFNEGENLSGLQRGDAAFVDVVHSNPGVLGKRDPLGDVDFYPGGLDPLPPGCVSVDCAHARSWEYYAESVYPGNEMNFLGTQCGSLTKLRQGKCTGVAVPMGYSVPRQTKGNYFLGVEPKSPFGKNASKRSAVSTKCGLCKN